MIHIRLPDEMILMRTRIGCWFLLDPKFSMRHRIIERDVIALLNRKAPTLLKKYFPC